MMKLFLFLFAFGGLSASGAAPAKLIVAKFNGSMPEPSEVIGSNNWSDRFPYAPKVTFAVAHDGDALYIRYRVAEDCTRARAGKDQEAVYKDSCVEFFVAFDNGGYYNFEFNGIGTAFLSYQSTGGETVSASASVMALIDRESTLGSEVFEERAELDPWELVVRIPKEALFSHKFATLNGLSARGNFYKCGDELSKPHYLSWSPIVWEEPSFHQPQFFGVLEFK